MIHKPIILKNISLSFPHKICFEEFNAIIPYGSKIAVIGQNGCGKSTFLSIIQSYLSNDVVMGFVPQIIKEYDSFSGGERFHKALTNALKNNPNVLLLDEPTNHLDQSKRQSLLRMLQHYPGTLIVVSHDVLVLRNLVDRFLHIDQGKIHDFSGNYDDYKREILGKRQSLEKEVTLLNKKKKECHKALMKEQERASKSKKIGEKKKSNNRWLPATFDQKANRAENVSGKQKEAIVKKKEDALEELEQYRLPEAILPKFTLLAKESLDKVIISIQDGLLSYGNVPVLKNLYFQMTGRERVAICGDNGSGKTTLIKAILDDPSLRKEGDWSVLPKNDIGYLDQHYQNLDSNKSVLESIEMLTPTWSMRDRRSHLNDFLFRKNEEVFATIKTLSGGEKARLSLACIAAKPPKLLILDEMTNNLDLETREHVIQVLKEYPGAMLVISHDEEFLKEIGIESLLTIKNKRDQRLLN
jgi:ATPase subunit of ABC transporter with duplicated ATPase domains